MLNPKNEHPSTAAFIRELLRSGKSCKDIAREHELSERYVFCVQQRMRLKERPKVEASNGVKASVKTVPLDALIDQERLDPRRILREGLQAIGEGEVAMDETLRRDLQIGAEAWRRVSRDEEFAPFRALLPSRRAVWGRPRTIAVLREQDGVT